MTQGNADWKPSGAPKRAPDGEVDSGETVESASSAAFELTLVLVALAFAIYFVVDTWGQPPDSRVLSTGLAIVIGCLSLIVGGRVWLVLYRKRGAGVRTASSASTAWRSAWPAVSLLALSGALIVSLPRVGLGISVTVYLLLIYVVAGGVRSLRRLTVVALSGLLLAYIAQRYVFPSMPLFPR